jgi:hypothetical protein
MVKDYDAILDEGFNNLIIIDPLSVFVTWPGVVPWVIEDRCRRPEACTSACAPVDIPGAVRKCVLTLPGAVAVFRREGRPYLYQEAVVKAMGNDTFLIMRVRDVQAGGLKPQMMVDVQSRAHPEEPPVRYMVSHFDEQGDTNVHVYLLDVKEGAAPEPEPEPEPGGEGEGQEGQGGRRGPWNRRGARW